MTQRYTLIIDSTAQVCDFGRCAQPGHILIFEKGADPQMDRIGARCWDHFTPDLMALRDISEFSSKQ